MEAHMTNAERQKKYREKKKQQKSEQFSGTTEAPYEATQAQVDPCPETALQAPIEPSPSTAMQMTVFDVYKRRMERESTY